MPNAETERERQKDKREREGKRERERERAKRQEVGKTNRSQQSKGGPTETHKGQKKKTVKARMHVHDQETPNMHAASDTHRKDDEHRTQHTRDMHPPDRRRRERTSSEYATLHFLGRKAGRRRMHQITIMSKHLRDGEAYKKPLARASKKAVATTTRRTKRSTRGNKITKKQL